MFTTVAIQGQEASFHDIAAHNYFGKDIGLVPCDTFAETFQALQAGKADCAVVAIENSLYGSINEVYDLLLKHKFWIVGEVYLRIEQCLVGFPGASIKEIQEVHSQREALAQCEEYLDAALPSASRYENHDTAGSVADIKKWNDPTKAAIASSAAATLHGMEVLAHEIETHKQNYTRFVILNKTRQDNPKANKLSLILRMGGDHKPGALHHALGAFAERDISLSLIHSRPVIGRAWHYLFYIDAGCGLADHKLQHALAYLEAHDHKATILGSYVSGR